MPVTYPFDTTGLASSNFVNNEVHTLTEINQTPYRVIIPVFAPFYLDNLSVIHVSNTNIETPLVENVDFALALEYVDASRSIGKMVYGGITINTQLVNGTIKIGYQIIGGDWIADPNYVLEQLAIYVYNPRITVWDQVTNKQQIFPPINHDQSAEYIGNYNELIDAVATITDAIVNSPSNTFPIVAHLADLANPHNTTKEQVGLGDVPNLPLANDTDVTNREPIDAFITLRQLVETDILIQDLEPFIDHVNDGDNPHGTTKEQIGLGNVSDLEVATDQEVLDQTSTAKYILLNQAISLTAAKIAKNNLDNFLTAESLYLFTK